MFSHTAETAARPPDPIERAVVASTCPLMRSVTHSTSRYIACRPTRVGCRIAIYSHDTMGIGHIRRNLLIAQTLAHCFRRAAILLISGAREANLFALPSGTDLLSLPALHKQMNGRYQPRHLKIPYPDLIALRGRVIAAALESFSPDALIVDKVPRGVAGELDETLALLRDRPNVRCVLGLRDILDHPAAVQREWSEMESDATIRAHYDAVWLYGDPSVYNAVDEYQFTPEVVAKARFTGYLDQRQRLRGTTSSIDDPLARCGLPPGKLVLCVVGGGQDGARLAKAFCAATLPSETNGVVLTGPFMPREDRAQLQRQLEGKVRFRLLDFVSEPGQLIRRADRVVAMGGYNTLCEALSFEKPTLVVPRVVPRLEQWVRAERFREMGLVDVLHPDRLSATAISQWLGRKIEPRHVSRRRIDLNGLDCLPRLLEQVLVRPRTSRLHYSK